MLSVNKSGIRDRNVGEWRDWLHDGDQNMDPGRRFVVTAVVSNPRILGSKFFSLINFPKYKNSNPR
jgi:hypothetical protein